MTAGGGVVGTTVGTAVGLGPQAESTNTTTTIKLNTFKNFFIHAPLKSGWIIRLYPQWFFASG
jgi:hypothetical protein